MALRTSTALMQTTRRLLQYGVTLENTGGLGTSGVIGASGSTPVRNRSDIIGSGAGKGGGAGGSIVSAGGKYGEKGHAQEEEYFRKQQAEQLRALQKTLTTMKQAKLDYHRKQRDRHLEQIKKHTELMAKDKDSKHKIFIDSHKESAEAHEQYLKKIDKNWD